MRKYCKFVSLFAAMTMAAGTGTATKASAEEAAQSNLPLSIGLVVGTLGVGAEAAYNFNEHLSLRVSADYLKISHSVNVNDIDYRGSVRPQSLSALLDYYPFSVGFRISAGGVVDRNAVELSATPTSTVTIGGKPYTPTQVGTLFGNVTFPDLAPYVGLGYTTNHNGLGFEFITDIGVIFAGTPRAKLSATTGLVSLVDLQDEEADVQHKINPFKYYPVIKTGVAYHF